MKRTFIAMLLTVGLSSLLLGKTLVTVNGHAITDDIIPPTYTQLNQVEYNKLLEALEKKELLHADLLKSPLVQSAKFQEIFQQQKALAQQKYREKTGKELTAEQLRAIKGDIALALFQKEEFEKTFVTASELRSFYDTHLDKFNFPDAIYIATAILPTQNEATMVLNRVKQAPDVKGTFQQLSQEYPGKVTSGWLTRDTTPPNLFNSAYNSAINSLVQTPIQTELGYHVVYLLNKKPAGLLPFEESKKRIELIVKQKKVFEKLENRVNNLYANALIVLN